MSVINETMGASMIMPSAQCDLELSTSRKGVVSSISIVGKLLNLFQFLDSLILPVFYIHT